MGRTTAFSIAAAMAMEVLSTCHDAEAWSGPTVSLPYVYEEASIGLKRQYSAGRKMETIGRALFGASFGAAALSLGYWGLTKYCEGEGGDGGTLGYVLFRYLMIGTAVEGSLLFVAGIALMAAGSSKKEMAAKAMKVYVPLVSLAVYPGGKGVDVSLAWRF